MALIKKFFCPVNGWDCHYWKEDGSCSMIDKGLNPVEECDDAAFFWVFEEDCPYVWEDEDGNRYDVQELLEQGYHFVNGEPIFSPDFAETMKITAEILKSLPVGIETIEIRRPTTE